MHNMQKNISLLLCTIFFLWSYSSLVSHGFAAQTRILLSNHSQKTIHSLCLQALRNTTYVTSYNIHNPGTINNRVHITGQSETNCYIRLNFDNQFTTADDILCSPVQEFYLPLTHQWIPAYMLKRGDELLTKDMNLISLRHKEFVSKPIKIYMIEVEHTHTFFVGKDSVLTHNNFLPLALNLGFIVPFGTVATGSAGSFFGPIGLLAGFAIGSIMGITIKAICRNRIPHYQVPVFNISFIKNSCDSIDFSRENIPTNPKSCFSIQDSLDVPCVYTVETPLSQTPTGCIEITTYISDNFNQRSYNKNYDVKEPQNNGCFSPEEKTLHKNQVKTPAKENTPEKKPTARNWKEFEENCHMGQKYGKKFVHTGKQNPKDGSPIRKLTEDIPHTEMFKKNYHFAPDRFHDGDHFEVWDKRGNWIGVANLDGSKNTDKSNMVKNKNTRDIKDIL